MRRTSIALALIGVLFAFGALPRSTATAATADSLRIGTSVEGRPIEVGCLGSGEHTVLVVGGLHTGPEAHSSDLALELARLAWSGELELPSAARLCVLPTLNPDGLVRGRRTNANDVDLNRNWPSLNWSAAAYHPEGGAVSGGDQPLSEPETGALWSYVLQSRPAVVVVLHCCGAVVEANDSSAAQALAGAYGRGATMQPIAQWTAYPITGQFIDAMDRIEIAAIDVEMAALGDTAVDSHRAALELVLAAVGDEPTPPHAAVGRPATAAQATYRVRSGDTLANIAGRYGTTATLLARTNLISRPELIEIGQVLVIQR